MPVTSLVSHLTIYGARRTASPVWRLPVAKTTVGPWRVLYAELADNAAQSLGKCTEVVAGALDFLGIRLGTLRDFLDPRQGLRDVVGNAALFARGCGNLLVQVDDGTHRVFDRL